MRKVAFNLMRALIVAAIVLSTLGVLGHTSLHAAKSTFYALCETDHSFWTGPERETYRAAQADADAHNKSVHGGEEYAWVAN